MSINSFDDYDYSLLKTVDVADLYGLYRLIVSHISVIICYSSNATLTFNSLERLNLR